MAHVDEELGAAGQGLTESGMESDESTKADSLKLLDNYVDKCCDQVSTSKIVEPCQGLWAHFDSVENTETNR